MVPFYCETSKTVNTRNIFGMLSSCKEKPKTKPKATMVLFVARLLIFAVIGHNTMSLPEICQVLTVMLSLTEVLSSDIQKNIIPR